MSSPTPVTLRSTNVTVSDDQGVPVSCPATALAPEDEMTCQATGVAAPGSYANIGDVTGTDPTETEVSDEDPSHYFGSVSEIHVEKLTNGVDADEPIGPVLPNGGAVTWTYEVTNPGNVPIRSVELVDDKGVVPQFTGGDDGDEELEPGEVWTYSASGAAVAGQYVNTATVTGLDVLENELRDSDPAHYFTQVPSPPSPSAPPGPNLELTKVAQKQRVRAGNVVGFRLRVRNTGEGTARRVRVCDRLPTGLVLTSAKGARIRNGRACFTVRTLRPQRSRTFTVRARAVITERSRRICNVAARSARGVTVRLTRECIRVLPETAQGPCPLRAAVADRGRTPRPAREPRPAPWARTAC